MEENVKMVSGHLKKHKKTYISVGVILLLVVLIFIGYKKGYRFQENFMIGKIGFLSMEIVLPDTNIFIDNNQKIVTTKDNEIVTLPLSPRNHTVIISHDSYFPWKKDFSIPSDSIVNLIPIFVSSNPSGAIISTNDSGYWKIRNKIITDALPTKNSPRISKDGSTKLWIDQNAVMVEVSSTTNPTEPPQTKTVVQPDPAIKNLYFYKDRSDVVMFSVDNAIYAIDVNKDGTQNFLPIYKGLSPSFVEASSTFIYVLDGDTLMQVVI